ncbi:MAG TPA: cellulose binding domain-containing protein [Vulgatibacteraceae bacterium]|nr:cellulose binding domain-containing protein [Vulgatibacteraceae bacterium]
MAEIAVPGEVLGDRYRLERPLDAGGMAIVWRAADTVLDRAVAVKVPKRGWPERHTKRLRQEAKAAAGLNHPNITGVHDYGEHGGVPYVVMELLDGETLAARLSRGPLPWDEAAATCARVADALSAAHTAGIVHRDIKPANVFLTSVGVKVLDFGIAFTGPSASGAPVLGTPAYVAPELLDGTPPSPAADVYSLGVVLQESLTGASAADAPTLPPDVPGEVAALCLRCLNPDPEARPTAPEAASVLAEAAGVQLVAPPAPATGVSDARGSAPPPENPTRILDDPLPEDDRLPQGTRPSHDERTQPGDPLPDGVPSPQEARGDSPHGGRGLRGTVGRAAARRPLAVAGAAAGAAAVVAVLLAALSPDSSRDATAPPEASPEPTTAAAPVCAVDYRIDGTWPEGFQATVRITNLGDAEIDGWELGFEFPDGQAVTQLWNGSRSQDGASVTVRAADWNRSIPPSGSAEFGFLGRQDGANGSPSRFTLNGRECRS